VSANFVQAIAHIGAACSVVLNCRHGSR
jgi:hypothetical protein